MEIKHIKRMIGNEGQFWSLGKLMERVTAPGRATWLDLPNSSGIYAIRMDDWTMSSLTDEAGAARYAYPTDIRSLRAHQDYFFEHAYTDILYIGQTKDLRKRVQQLVRFGLGKADNHRSGQVLWQIDDIADAELWMWIYREDNVALLGEQLLNVFEEEYDVFPFANYF